MIGGCLTSGKYNMTADLYVKQEVENEKTGQIKAQYVIESQGFSLIARGLSNLRGKDSGTLQDYGNKLNEYHFLRVKTMQAMAADDLITNIRDADGNLYQAGDGVPIQFIVLGVTPTYEPFGSFMEYDILCNKAEVEVNLDGAFDTVQIGSTESSEVVVL